MLDLYPDYYKEFACLGGACPDTCCAQWEVVVDDDTAARYAVVPGDLGRRLRAALTLDEDGDRILRFPQGRCPLLTEDSLCSVQKALGHEALCRTCREFPRLCQDYTVFREHSLSLSCPEAARLILLSPRLPVLECSGAEDPEDAADVDYDPKDLALLRSVRSRLFGILGNTGLSFPRRLALCLEAARLAQAEWDGTPPAAGPTVPSARDWDPQAFRDLFRSMDILSPEWASALESLPASAHPSTSDPSPISDPSPAPNRSPASILSSPSAPSSTSNLSSTLNPSSPSVHSSTPAPSSPSVHFSTPAPSSPSVPFSAPSLSTTLHPSPITGPSSALRPSPAPGLSSASHPSPAPGLSSASRPSPAPGLSSASRPSPAPDFSPASESPDPFLEYPQIFSNFCYDAFYRNLFCAVADFDLLPRVQAAAAACLLCRDLARAQGGSQETLLRLLCLYDREVEHCADNRDALLDACCEMPCLSLPSLFSRIF